MDADSILSQLNILTAEFLELDSIFNKTKAQENRLAEIECEMVELSAQLQNSDWNN